MNKHLLLTVVSILFMGAAFSQQKVKDGTVQGNTFPNGNAILELESANKGLLHTRVMLTSSTEATPLSQHVEGMMVYNTATVNDVVPGIYYNDGARWVLAGAVTQGANNISYNPVSYEITYVDDQGDTQVINLREIVRTNETVTTLVDNEDGSFTYTNEAGEAVTFDANTTTMIDNGDGTYTFTNANGDAITVDVPASVVENITNEGEIFNAIENLIKNIGGNVYYDGDQFTYVDGNGDTQTINFEELVQANETVTALVDNTDGTYTYYNESEMDDDGNPIPGTGVTIDVPADVISNFEEIISNETVLNELIEQLTNTTVGGNVYYDGNQFTYVDGDGNTQTINFEELVQANETVTTLVDNEDGTYTYTSEDGTETIVDVPASVVNQFEEVVNGGPVTINGETYNTIEEYIQHLVEANETVTTLVDNEDGTYTYTSEDGTETIVDVPASVVNQFEEVVNGGPVTVNGETYNTIEEYIQHLVEANETVTTLVDNEDGTYTYTSEDGTETIVDVPASVVNQFEEVVNGGPVTVNGETYNTIEEYIQHLVEANETVTTLVDNEDGTYTYTSEDGTETIVDVPASVVNQFEEVVNGGPVTINGETYNTIEEYIQHLVEANETVTTLVNNNDGTYTYTNEAGDAVTIDVPADVISNFEEIISNETVLNELIEQLTNTTVGGNVYYDGNQFTYVDGDGNTQTINFEELVQANETVTTLEDNGDGTYTYTSEDGTETIVDVPASVVNQFEEVVNGGPVTINGETYNTIEEYIQHLVEANETVTTLVDNEDGTYTYTSEDGTETIVDVPASVVNQFEEVVNGGPVTINGETYNTIEEYIQHLVEANETVTTLVNNNDGTYTYTNEAGDAVTIDVPADVISNFEEIINNETVLNELIEQLTNTTVGGNVYYDGNQFTYVDGNGDTQTINFEELVQANETVTALVDNGDGTYTYTSEDGTETIVDVPASVVNRFEEVVNGGPVTINGETYNTVEEYIRHLVEANETVTALVNNNDGTYTYTNEAGDAVTIDVPADVISNFEEIISNETVLNELIEQLTNTTVGGNVYYDGNQFTYVDGDGNTQTINFEELVQANETVTALVDNGDGTYTYTSEDGTETIVDVPASVVNRFEEVVNGGPVTINGETYNTVEEYIRHLVEANETVTALVNNNDGTYTYTNEAGDAVTIDVPADVISNFEEIISNETVLNELIEQLTNTTVGGNVYYDGNQFTYVDGDGNTQTINFEELVQANETVTTLVNNNDGTYTYTSEDGTETIVDVPASVVNQFEEVVNGGPVTINGETYNTIEEYIQHLVEANETVTTLVNNNDGTYTYTNEAGDAVTIDVPADVISNFEEIINNETVLNELIEQLTNTTVGGNVYYDGNQFTYVDGNGDTQTIDLSEIAIEPWLNQADGTKATENTQDIYQMGKVAINTAITDKQLEVKGDMTATYSGAGIYNIIDNNYTPFGGGNVVLSANAENPVDASQYTSFYTRLEAAGLTSLDGDKVASVVAYSGEIDHRFRHPGGMMTNYTFPRDNGSVNHVLTTDGHPTSAQLSWKSISDLLEVTASNGVNIDATSGDIKLGGNLTEATTITNDGYPLTIATGGTATSITGLPQTEQADYNAITGATGDQLVSVDADGLLKQLKAAMPKFFYMPSVIIPIASDQLEDPLTGESFNDGTRQGTIDLYGRYAAQFGSPMASNAGATTILPVLPANELDYHIAWYNSSVFENVSVSDAGILTYTVKADADVTVGSFMNVVFAIKP